MLKQPTFRTTRRRFAFWVGLGLFTLSEKLRADVFDDLAAATMRQAEPDPDEASQHPEHWSLADNQKWWWYERETWLDGQWKVTGITTPVNKETGKRYRGKRGYLDERLVPQDVRKNYSDAVRPSKSTMVGADDEGAQGEPHATRRARHGRPPSKWLRSLHAEELRAWLETIEVPEVGVSGMTFWIHLTRDHAFDPKRIRGLTEPEQAKLHAAAHFGY